MTYQGITKALFTGTSNAPNLGPVQLDFVLHLEGRMESLKRYACKVGMAVARAWYWQPHKRWDRLFGDL